MSGSAPPSGSAPSSGSATTLSRPKPATAALPNKPNYKQERVPINMVHRLLPLTIFGTCLALCTAVGCMMHRNRNNDDASLMQGPYWDPASNVSFSDFQREEHAWLNVTNGRLSPPQQAAALQRGL
eukprot:7040155-Pyramimonas_sp.AAC.1